MAPTSKKRSPARSRLTRHELLRRLRRVQFFFMDVDGVLTDATVWIGAETELKQFNIQDGMGLVLLRRQGIKVGLFSSRPSPATLLRAEELKVDVLGQSKAPKVRQIEDYLATVKGSWDQVAYAGDDLVDLGPLQRAAVGFAVANAVPEVHAAADYVTTRPGGHGAVRELADLILNAKGWQESILEDYASQS